MKWWWWKWENVGQCEMRNFLSKFLDDVHVKFFQFFRVVATVETLAPWVQSKNGQREDEKKK
jgi:hypothetical protein